MTVAVDIRDHPTHARTSWIGILIGVGVAALVVIFWTRFGAVDLTRILLWFAALAICVLIIGIWSKRQYSYCRCTNCGERVRRSASDGAFSYFPCERCGIQWRSRFVMVPVTGMD